MRLLKISAYVIVFLFAIYSGVWYFNAKANANKVQEWLNELAESPNVKTLTYSEVALRGYPFTIKVVIKNPKISAETTQLRNYLYQLLQIPSPDTSKELTDMSIDEALIIQSNVIGSYYKFLAVGDIHTQVQSKTRNLQIRQKSDKSYVKLSINFMDALFKYQNLEKLFSETAQAEQEANRYDTFEKLSWVGDTIEAYNEKDKQLLYKADWVQYGITKKALENEEYRITGEMEANDLLFTEAYKQNFKDLSVRLEAVTGMGDLEAHGPMDGHIKLSYTGPFDQTKMDSIKNPVEFEINLLFKSKLYEYKTDGLAQATFKEGDFNRVDIEIAGDAKFTPESHPYFIEVFKNIITQMQDEVKKTQAEVQTRSLNPSALQQEPEINSADLLNYLQKNINTLVPKLHELGTIDYKFKMTTAADGPYMKIAIPTSHFKNALYGIESKVDLKATILKATATGDITLKFIEFDNYFKRVDRYVNLLIGYYDQHEPQSKPPFLNKDMVPKLKKFLRALSEEKDDKSRDVTLKMQFLNKEPHAYVGDKTLEEVSKMYYEIFMNNTGATSPPPATP